MSKYKSGLDYFSFDIDFFNDQKIEFVSAKYGNEGELIAIKLLCKIYRNGYYLNWGDDECLLFSKKAGDNISVELVNNVITELLKRDFFSDKLYKKYHILTSNGIQKRFLEATKRRKEVLFYKEYYLLNNHNAYITQENVNIISINDDIEEQSKVKESKVKESKETSLSGKPDFEAPIQYLNKKAGRNFDPKSESSKNFIKARFKEGRSIEDFKKVVDKKVIDWGSDERMMKFLRPSTLFNRTNFENYLNEPEPDPLQKYYKKEKKY